MITLFGSRRMWGLANSSPFVTKTEVHLRMAGLPYETDKGLSFGPKGKIPYIVDDGLKLGDSTFIRWHIEQKYGFDFDPGHSGADLGAAWAFEKLCEDNLYWALVHMRWAIDDQFAKGPRTFFEGVPAPIRPVVVAMVRRKVRKNLHAHGMGRHSKAEVERIAIHGLKALADFIGDKPFLLGERPCGSDAMVYATVSGILCARFDSPIRDAAENMPALVEYCERMAKKYFPEGL